MARRLARLVNRVRPKAQLPDVTAVGTLNSLAPGAELARIVAHDLKLVASTPLSVVVATEVLAASTMIRETLVSLGMATPSDYIAAAEDPWIAAQRLSWTARFEWLLTEELRERGVNLAGTYTAAQLAAALAQLATTPMTPTSGGGTPPPAGFVPTSGLDDVPIGEENPVSAAAGKGLSKSYLPSVLEVAMGIPTIDKDGESTQAPKVPSSCSPTSAGAAFGPFGKCGVMGGEAPPDPVAALNGGVPSWGGTVPFWLNPDNPCYGLQPEHVLGLVKPPDEPGDQEIQLKSVRERPEWEAFEQKKRQSLDPDDPETLAEFREFVESLRDQTFDGMIADLHTKNVSLAEAEALTDAPISDTKDGASEELVGEMNDSPLLTHHVETYWKAVWDIGNAEIALEEYEKLLDWLEARLAPFGGGEPPNQSTYMPSPAGGGTDANMCRKQVLAGILGCMVGSPGDIGSFASCEMTKVATVMCGDIAGNCHTGPLCGCSALMGGPSCFYTGGGMVQTDLGGGLTSSLKKVSVQCGSKESTTGEDCPPTCGMIASSGDLYFGESTGCPDSCAGEPSGATPLVGVMGACASSDLTWDLFLAFGCGVIDPLEAVTILPGSHVLDQTQQPHDGGTPL